MRSAPTRFAARHRRGFTLVEMLVTIVIIVILVSLTAAGYFLFVGSTQKRNTEDMFRSVNKTLMQHWKFVAEEAAKETPSPGVVALAMNDMPRAKVLWIKARLVEAFPMSYDEIYNGPMYKNIPGILVKGNPAPAIPADRVKYAASYRGALKGVPSTGSATESAACLLIALSVSRGGNRLTPDTLGPYIVDTAEDPTTTGSSATSPDGIPELVDGWRTSIGFFRFAWNDPTLQAAKPATAASSQSRFADPQDPQGTLLNPTWYGTTLPMNYRATTETYFGFTISPDNGNSAYYVAPVMASAGADKALVPMLLGLNADLSVNTAAAVADNIYSYNLR